MPRSERQSEIFKGYATFQESVTMNGAFNVNTPIIPASGVISGVGQINSGDASATVSTAAVTSGGGIFLTPVAISSPSFIGSGQPGIGVNSIVENTSFMAVTAGGISTTSAIGFRWFLTA